LIWANKKFIFFKLKVNFVTFFNRCIDMCFQLSLLSLSEGGFNPTFDIWNFNNGTRATAKTDYTFI
jgi:hypothetical protein